MTLGGFYIWTGECLDCMHTTLTNPINTSLIEAENEQENNIKRDEDGGPEKLKTVVWHIVPDEEGPAALQEESDSGDENQWSSEESDI